MHRDASGRSPTCSSSRAFPPYDLAERRRVVRYLRRHRRVVRGWIKVVLGQGARDPWATVKARMRDVLLRTDLWSDQILVLRAVQTLTMLDLQHNCELVWNLGGYTRPDGAGVESTQGPPRSDVPGHNHEAGHEFGVTSEFDAGRGQ